MTDNDQSLEEKLRNALKKPEPPHVEPPPQQQPAPPAPPEAPKKAKAVEPAKPMVTGFAGNIGLPFAIYGTGFGVTKSFVSLNGQHAEITAWRDTSIKGMVPATVEPGAVKVQVGHLVVFDGQLS